MDEEKSARNSATSKALEISPVDSALNQNDELISAIEKQVEVLGSRLTKVSNVVPEDPGDDTAGVRGNSDLVSTIGSHGHRLSKVSNTLSRLTRNLEI